MISRHLEEDEEGTTDRQNKHARTDLHNDDCDDDVTDVVNAPPPGMVIGEGVLGGREVSVSRLFSEDDRKIAVRVVWSHGGKVVSRPRGDYHLVPLEVSASHVTQTEATTVTMIWLVSSLNGLCQYCISEEFHIHVHVQLYTILVLH